MKQKSKEKDTGIPQKYMDLVGTKKVLSGGVFSGKTSIKPTEFDVLDIRIGSSVIINVKELIKNGESSIEHPTFELLIKKDGMRASRWTRAFPIKEVNLKL